MVGWNIVQQEMKMKGFPGFLVLFRWWWLDAVLYSKITAKEKRVANKNENDFVMVVVVCVQDIFLFCWFIFSLAEFR